MRKVSRQIIKAGDQVTERARRIDRRPDSMVEFVSFVGVSDGGVDAGQVKSIGVEFWPCPGQQLLVLGVRGAERRQELVIPPYAAAVLRRARPGAGQALRRGVGRISLEDFLELEG